MNNEELQNKIEELERKVLDLETQVISYPLNKESKGILARSFDFLRVKDAVSGGYFRSGNAQMSGFDLNFTGNPRINRMLLITGEQEGQLSDASNNSQLTLEDNALSNGSSNMSFFYGMRGPIYVGSGSFSISSSAATLTDGQFTWTTNELAGAYIIVLSSAGQLDSVKIASNTADTITVERNWKVTDTVTSYMVYMPVYLGSAGTPWRRGYFGEDVRLGFGASDSSTVLYIKWGNGSPESSVTANVGSLYLRQDGGASTTLYVKESGTGSTGWIAK